MDKWQLKNIKNSPSPSSSITAHNAIATQSKSFKTEANVKIINLCNDEKNFEKYHRIPYKRHYPQHDRNNQNSVSFNTLSHHSLNGYSNEYTFMQNIHLPAQSVPSQINVHKLFQNLLATGLINMEKPSLNKRETLKKRYENVINALYSGWQCSSCGIRFPNQQYSKHQEHLDWHFQQNRCMKKLQSQNWYQSASDWIQSDQIESSHETNYFESVKKLSSSKPTQSLPICIAGPNDHNKVCDMCSDKFELFYDDEAEEWFLQNAIRSDENVFHPICYKDFTKTTK